MSSQFAPSSASHDIRGITVLMEQLRIYNYVIVSALVFMFYDIIINLEHEIPLVWYYHQNNDFALPLRNFRRVKQVLIRLLFLFSRYYGLVFLTIMFAVNCTTGLSVTVFIMSFESILATLVSCQRYFYYLILAGTVLYVTIVNVILAARIKALYGGNHHCGVLVASLVVGEFLVEFSICVVMAVHSTAEIENPPPWISWPGCMTRSRAAPTFTLASWLIALLVSTIFCVMTLKGIQFDKSEGILGPQDMYKLFPRTKVLLSDCVTFYFLTFVIVLVSTIVLTVVKNALSALPVPLLVAVYSYCASRLILNIRVVDNKHRPADVSDNPDSLPPMPFLTLPTPNEQPVASSSRV